LLQSRKRTIINWWDFLYGSEVGLYVGGIICFVLVNHPDCFFCLLLGRLGRLYTKNDARSARRPDAHHRSLSSQRFFPASIPNISHSNLLHAGVATSCSYRLTPVPEVCDAAARSPSSFPSAATRALSFARAAEFAEGARPRALCRQPARALRRCC
jgi:hypothetical protein